MNWRPSSTRTTGSRPSSLAGFRSPWVDYEGARENFAHALLYRPGDPALLFGLAQASYYLGDMETAFAAINRARELQPTAPEIVAGTRPTANWHDPGSGRMV